MNSLTGLSPDQLRRAADLQEQILELQAELNQLLGTPAESGATAAKKRKPAAKGQTNTRAGAKKIGPKAKDTEVAAEPAEKPKREVSPAARKKMAAAQRARRNREKAQAQATA